MRTILTAIALIGLIGCVTKNYYLVYPVKVEQIETYKYPSIDPGFYRPVPYGITVPGYGIGISPKDFNGWIIGDTLISMPICTDTTLRIRCN